MCVRATDARLSLLLVLVLHLSLVPAQLFYDVNEQEESIELTQLWSEGYWKQVRFESIECFWQCSFPHTLVLPVLPPFALTNLLLPFSQITSINGTITWNRNGDMRGKIVLSPLLSPHETYIREFQRKGASAIVFYRPGAFHPGLSMYFVDASDRRDLAIPTMEATFTKDKSFLLLPEGAFIRCLPTENLHKKATETKFQLIMNLIHSFWEMAIIAIAAYRIYQFYVELHVPIYSIAPLCCTLEGVAAALRLAYTVVDPFFTYRMLSYDVSIVLVTISWPFSEAAGILLTFFCTYDPLRTRERTKEQKPNTQSTHLTMTHCHTFSDAPLIHTQS